MNLSNGKNVAGESTGKVFRRVRVLSAHGHVRRSCSRGFSSHSKAERPSASHKVRMRNDSLITPTSRSMEAIGLKLAKEGFELGLTEILGQQRDEGFLIMDFEGGALCTPRDNVAVVRLFGFIQEDV